MHDLRGSASDDPAILQPTDLACDIGHYVSLLGPEDLKRLAPGRYREANPRELIVKAKGKYRYGHVWPMMVKRVG